MTRAQAGLLQGYDPADLKRTDVQISLAGSVRVGGANGILWYGSRNPRLWLGVTGRTLPAPRLPLLHSSLPRRRRRRKSRTRAATPLLQPARERCLFLVPHNEKVYMLSIHTLRTYASAHSGSRITSETEGQCTRAITVNLSTTRYGAGTVDGACHGGFAFTNRKVMHHFTIILIHHWI